MAKVMILPLLKMSSGHHQVADVVKGELAGYGHQVVKIDLLSDSWQLLESSLTSAYQHTLSTFPQLYDSIYRRIAGPENYSKINFTNSLGALFIKSLQGIVEREQPDFIICTHGFPSSILDRLKRNNKCSVPVANIYTDFFVNNFWGCSNIEYHFVSSPKMKEKLLHRNKNLKVIISGIPVHKQYRSTMPIASPRDHNILITGGSSGLGSIKKLIRNLNPKGDFNYYILCGTNNRLHQRLLRMNYSNLIPLSYINNKEEICKLYDRSSLIIGKPGGVTISECLHRRRTYYVHQCLPGQEFYNLQYLEEMGLVINGSTDALDEVQLGRIVNNQQAIGQLRSNIENYIAALRPGIGALVNEILTARQTSQTAGGSGYYE